ncbi:MAG: undecaprenyl-diphosphate phosphatase [Chitinophagaceae bacterium]|nr:MAG: undecaprenyl-diphosphate phosphatase [Chitinophagaceae bacterium]
MTILEAIITAIVEGLTEFLPISSTGHMIISSYLLGIHQDEFTKLMEVSIQLGAILAVVVLYWKKFFQPNFLNRNHFQFYLKLLIGVLPAICLGLFFSDTIDALLESPLTVAITMLLGGIFLLFIDSIFKTHTIEKDEAISFKNAFIIGCWQTIAMIPGVSRSAASIIGGMQQKLTRSLAAEFSFFLAVPTMLAATGYTLFLKDWKNDQLTRKGFTILFESSQNLTCFIIGNIVAFIVALLAIKFFIGYLQKHGFRFFGWYRIIVGAILFFFILSGRNNL